MRSLYPSHQVLPALAGLLVTGMAWAQPLPLKPGLWQVTSRVSVDGKTLPELGEVMKGMNPERRRQLEAAMAKQGLVLSPGGGGAVRVCFTQADLQRGVLGQPDPRGNCVTQVESRSNTAMRYRFTCTQPPSAGTAEVTHQTDSAFTNRVQAITQHQGKELGVLLTGQGEWLSADCGSVKPVGSR